MKGVNGTTKIIFRKGEFLVEEEMTVHKPLQTLNIASLSVMPLRISELISEEVVLLEAK